MWRSGVLVVLLLVGCSGSSETVPVEGVVRLDGQPLPDASVHFVPEGTGRDATATTDQDGHFRLSTFEGGDGAMPGTYKVVITPTAPVQEIQEGMTADQAMEAASAAAAKGPVKPAGPSIPESYTRADQTPLKQTVPPEGEIVIELNSKG